MDQQTDMLDPENVLDMEAIAADIAAGAKAFDKARGASRLNDACSSDRAARAAVERALE